MNRTRADLYSDTRYRCCCNLCHSSSGSVLIGALQLFAVVADLLHLTMATSPLRDFLAMNYQVMGAIVGILAVATIVLLHVYGVYCRCKFCIIPFLIFQILLVITFVVASSILAVKLLGALIDVLSDDHKHKRGRNANWKVVLFALSVLAAALHFWFVIVVRRAYRYVQAVREMPKAGQGQMNGPIALIYM